MIADIRIAISFKGHRKRKRLNALLGLKPSALDYLLDLWITTAQNHPTGELSGMDELDIALDAGWPEDPSKFVDALLESGFLEKIDGTYFLHDWPEHLAYVFGEPERKARGRRANEIRWGNARPNGNAGSPTGSPQSESGSPTGSPPYHTVPYQEGLDKESCLEKERTKNTPPLPPAGVGASVPLSAYLPSESRPGANAEPSESSNAKAHGTRDEKLAATPAEPPDFTAFWAVYPKKKSKQAALKAWKKARHKPPLAELLAAVEQQKYWPEWTRENGRYIPHPATWLNDGAWSDQPDSGMDVPDDSGPWKNYTGNVI
jgi:hypothetical protein